MSLGHKIKSFQAETGHDKETITQIIEAAFLQYDHANIKHERNYIKGETTITGYTAIEIEKIFGGLPPLELLADGAKSTYIAGPYQKRMLFKLFGHSGVQTKVLHSYNVANEHITVIQIGLNWPDGWRWISGTGSAMMIQGKNAAGRLPTWPENKQSNAAQTAAPASLAHAFSNAVEIFNYFGAWIRAAGRKDIKNKEAELLQNKFEAMIAGAASVEDLKKLGLTVEETKANAKAILSKCHELIEKSETMEGVQSAFNFANLVNEKNPMNLHYYKKSTVRLNSPK